VFGSFLPLVGLGVRSQGRCGPPFGKEGRVPTNGRHAGRALEKKKVGLRGRIKVAVGAVWQEGKKEISSFRGNGSPGGVGGKVKGGTINRAGRRRPTRLWPTPLSENTVVCFAAGQNEKKRVLERLFGFMLMSAELNLQKPKRCCR